MIASLATGIALEMGLPREEIERIRIASLLHDLGKIAIPTRSSTSPRPCRTAEWQTIGEHPRIGQVILEQASSLREAIPVVLHHHERFNGGGYPHGLRGSEIPLGARIVAVADAYHAMVHDRPYSAALDHEQALEELRAHAGTQFDPKVVDVFCDIYADAVPPDGLEEVYRLHERARGGLAHIDDDADGMASAHAWPSNGSRPKRRPRPTRSGFRGRPDDALDDHGGAAHRRRGLLGRRRRLSSAGVLAAPPAVGIGQRSSDPGRRRPGVPVEGRHPRRRHRAGESAKPSHRATRATPRPDRPADLRSGRRQAPPTG